MRLTCPRYCENQISRSHFSHSSLFLLIDSTVKGCFASPDLLALDVPSDDFLLLPLGLLPCKRSCCPLSALDPWREPLILRLGAKDMGDTFEICLNSFVSMLESIVDP